MNGDLGSRSSGGGSYDAVVVGASLAGCTTAILLARAGLHVALVERSPDPRAFKRICGHFIQSSALPVFERLGVMNQVFAAGAIRTRLSTRTPWGWIVPSGNGPATAALNLRRERLDPLLREVAAGTPGVELILGHEVDALVFDEEAVAGVEARDTKGRRVRLPATLTVGADGRSSRVGQLAQVRVRTHPHERFLYGAYFDTGESDRYRDSHAWMTDRNWLSVLPTDSALTAMGFMGSRQHDLEPFRKDALSALLRIARSLPDAPAVDDWEFVWGPMGKIDMTIIDRRPTAPGMALVGDAALCTDPLWAVGCGWALESGAWLADSVAAALRREEPVTRGLARYRRKRRQLRSHCLQINRFAEPRPLNAVERLMFSSAVRDPLLADQLELLTSRNVSAVPRPAWLARAAIARLRTRSVKAARYETHGSKTVATRS